MTSQQPSEGDDFDRGLHGIPDDEKFEVMSFVQLASALSSCDSGSPKFMVIEREMKKHLAKDQAEINLKNVIIGGIMAGIFGLSGVVLGWWLRDSSTMQQPTSSSSEYQIQQGKLSEMTSTANISAIKAVSGQPIAVPNKVENNAQPRQTKP
jgi:hypothetical protein